MSNFMDLKRSPDTHTLTPDVEELWRKSRVSSWYRDHSDLCYWGKANMDRKRVDRIRKHLLQWYQKNHRSLAWRNTDDPYRIWVSEVMLQQTQVKTVEPYFERFLSEFPTVEHLACADLQAVLKVWEGMGYYGRARNLHRAARLVLARYGGKIPNGWKDFRELPGVGDYIASAVLSIAYRQPYAVVDGNVKRVLARLFEIESPVNQRRGLEKVRTIADKLLDRGHPGIYNQAVMELGAIVCKVRTPDCNLCPVQEYCQAHHHGRSREYPKRVTPKPRPTRQIAVGVIYRDGRVLITQRSNRGLLGGLWEFPGGRIEDGEDPAEACRREIEEEVNLEVAVETHLTQVKHGYTHFKVVLEVFKCRYVSGEVRLNGPVAHRWVTFNELETFPFPKANLKFMHLLNEK
jgi:A/G-specific adenine glycosylase